MSGTVTLDLGGVEAWEAGGQILPPGKHAVTINDAEIGTSSGGHPQFEVEFASAEGSIRDWIVCAPAAMGKVRAFLEAAGVQIPAGEFQFRADALRGKRLAIVVREEDYQGAKRSRVAGYAALEGGQQATQSAPVGAASDLDDIPFMWEGERDFYSGRVHSNR